MRRGRQRRHVRGRDDSPVDDPVVRWRVRVVRGQAGVGVVQAGDGDPLRLVDLLLLVGEEGRIWKRERRVRSQFDMGENGRARTWHGN